VKTPLILSIETATLAGSISLSKGAELLSSSAGDSTLSHSNTLLADIDRLLETAGIKVNEVELFAVASGPGSFTGLRIGIATVKALAVTLNRPCIGIPTLEAVAHAAGPTERVVALLPAGRGEVFCQMFSVSAAGEVTVLDGPAHLSPAKMIDRYRQFDEITWAGEGAKLYADLISEAVAPKQARVLEPPANLAQHVALLASLRLAAETEQSADNLHAIYVRPSDAELKC
jgi:tRNA threonylcarbamoyladenosine biosynthesis protein TsaB